MSELVDAMRRTLDQLCLKKRAVYFPRSVLLGGELRERSRYHFEVTPSPEPVNRLELRRRRHRRQYRRWDYGKYDKGYHIPSIRPYQGGVYFIQDKTERSLIKIGFSKNLHRRLSELELQVEGGFVFLGAIRGLPADEKIAHKMFWQFREMNNANRHYTEWFYPVKPILFFIKHFCTTGFKV